MSRTLRLSLILVAVAGLTSATLADFQANLGPSHSTLGGLGGGSFGVDLQGTTWPPGKLYFGPSLTETWNSGANSDQFGRTFCVESVTFNPQTWYHATIDATILNGAPGQKVKLTAGTRLLFANYAMNPSALGAIFNSNGVLGWGTVGGNANGNWNKVMQAYFWDQQFVNSTGSTMRALLNANEKNAYDALGGLSATGYEKDVFAFNLWAGSPYLTDKQSHLVVYIPAPAAVLLGIGGVALLNALRRRLS